MDKKMKVIILAGGLPSTITNETEKIPKPMAEIGGRPILWHIMKQYSHYGFKDFIICAGYKGNMIKQYFTDYYIYQSDITVDLKNNHIDIHRKKTEDWNVTVVDTGEWSTIAARIKKIESYLDEDSFILSYGDCVSDINIKKMVEFHLKKGKIATVTVARPTGRNEILPVSSGGEIAYGYDAEAPKDAWVNACNMVLKKEIITYLEDKDSFLEQKPFRKLSAENQLISYRHNGFWSPMETKRDHAVLERLWNSRKAPWKIWE